MSADDKDLREHELRVEAFWNEKLESAVNALSEERSKRVQAEGELKKAEAALKDEQKRSAEALAAERTRHEATNKARLQAFATMESAVIEALHRSLAEERKAREAAEARYLAKHQQSVIVEVPKKEAPKSWRMDIVSRDSAGFWRSIDLTAK